MRRIDMNFSLEAVKVTVWVIFQCVYNLKNVNKLKSVIQLWDEHQYEQSRLTRLAKGHKAQRLARNRWLHREEQVYSWPHCGSETKEMTVGIIHEVVTTASLGQMTKIKGGEQQSKKECRTICWPHIAASGSEGRSVKSHKWLMYAELNMERLDLQPPEGYWYDLDRD